KNKWLLRQSDCQNSVFSISPGRKLFAFELAIKRREADAEKGGGFFLVATGILDRTLDVLDFLNVEMFLKVRERRVAIGRNEGSNRSRAGCQRSVHVNEVLLCGASYFGPLMISLILKIGRNMQITMPPTMTPRTTIRMGSINDVMP